MDDQLLRAKKMFTSYHGSTFHMYRKGDFEEYKKFDVQKEMEIEWFKEMIDEYTVELSIRDWTAVHNLELIASNYQDKMILENVISFAARHLMSADSIVKLMYAERIIEIINKTKKNISKELLHKSYKTTVIILEDIISKPLIIDPGHELNNYDLVDKRSLNNRAKRSIEVIKNDLH
ncbi:hypothetical protein [Cohnella luojiensis]|uniref:Uncharacterized protein n=1 Tax=Cohnella luojiensis TaxID=652876 RepID=A0A4Y8LMP4_9BACL|nr:hypothetical protein [Cohnella luojiensis]TFE19349.1 hypothetical protein E2980_23500 [Cohnella luojiensis]